MNRRHLRLRYTIQSEINIIPFLDVLLVLLVIFMIVPSTMIQGFEVNIPTSAESNIIDHKKNIIITIEIIGIGLYNFSCNEKCIKKINLKQLSLEIHNRIHLNSNIMCLIAADKDIKYDELIKILNFLNSIKIYSVGMITRPVNLNIR